ncbi:MAG: hypothetical protein JXB13_02875 [Phycisphaerae bacterium]|nr:hypothetical protein [Phycisphaerae bacterium]
MRTKRTVLAVSAASWVLLWAASFAARGAVLPVTSAADSGEGSLREALAGANDGDVIDASGVAGTITLTSGPLLVAGSLTVVGPGADALTVSGDSACRVFQISGSHVTIQDLTIADGFSAESGGGIHISSGSGSLVVLQGCFIAGNSTTLGGGGIWSSGGARLIVLRCVISGNSASGSGGGILNENSVLGVFESSISGNTAGVCGGGIMNDGRPVWGMVQIDHSTLDGNWANYGGGIYNGGSHGSASLLVESSTFSGNSAHNVAAISNDGAWSGSADVQIHACTFSGNTAGSANATIRNDGRFGGHAEVELGNTILVVGTPGVTFEIESGEVTSSGYNLSSDGGGGVLNHATDILHTDPLLGPLQDNGGPTFTQALLAGSPAIDAGNRGACWIDQDQRGVPGPFDDPAIANAAGGDGSDIGAFEVTPSLTVLQQKIKVSFAKPDKDSFSLVALLEPGDGFAPSGEAATVNTGGAVVTVVLDAKGRGATARGVIPAGKVTLVPGRVPGQWALKASFKRGAWQGPWAECGLVNANVPKPGRTVTMVVSVRIGALHFAAWHSMVYTAKADKSGSAK